MDELRRKYLAISATQDQDLEDAKRWWAETSEANKIRVWTKIQAAYDDPLMEIMSRFAQVGFTQVAMLCGGKRKGGDA